MKENKGVTLIALTVTIIVLLLLTGVAIAAITGQNSVIENANKAVELSKQDSTKEQKIIDKADKMLKKYLVDWEQAKNNAVKPAEQTQSNYIGLDKYGNIVDMDNWDVRYVEQIGSFQLGVPTASGQWWSSSAYLGEFDEEGRIIGEIPQCIKNNSDGKWYEVSYVSFANEERLKIAPELPDSITNMTSTFYGCINLMTVPIIPSSVEYMWETFVNCNSLTGEIEILTSCDPGEGLFNNASTNQGTNLVVKVKSQEILNKLSVGLSGNENITFEVSN